MEVICLLLSVYVLIVLVRIISSWFPMDPSSPIATALRVLDVVIDPVLVPIRRKLPPAQVGGMALDLSPLVLLLGVQVLAMLIGC